MSEEEIKDIIEEILQDPFIVFSQDASFESTQIKATAIQGLLDLYQKEKEKNKNYFSKTQIENAIHNSVSDYDCLVEKLNQMMYPDFYKKLEEED